MGNIRSYKELRVYQAAMDAAMRIFELTKTFPAEDKVLDGRPDAPLITFGMREHRRSLAQAALSGALRKQVKRLGERS